MKYKTISEQSLAELENKLNELSEEGWEPMFNFVFGKDGLGFDCWAVILYKPE